MKYGTTVILAKIILGSAFLSSAPLHARELLAQFNTGGDDVRGGSRIDIRVDTQSGVQWFRNINRASSLPNGSFKEFTINVANLSHPFDLNGVTIIHRSGNCTFCSYDNWSMSSFSLVTKDTKYPLLGHGFHRFRGNSPSLYIESPEF
ncbi:hypothetical protein [Pseudobacteriovorax antillogorgiicola]|uniref:Uncharacterized protein n=1 Tax=Pseudobacteriovorax antillogorgiicola TaxID=1513793 RepID=A0A1Y6BHQ6_9BACT|nr:hypothetical protein [Pseudobacteriovorax antillogorgiicola]TCS57362.1 hypothetical protein EDD56_103102 [Pseudobacteriovorax antillogorgiicola]SMF01994.1 hypothetical protein SAMN06296036_103231 [Pseudobacteriovorax antillogorgiicola]